jgi:hypothetical protein
MAAGPLLTSESLQRYRALGTAGDPAWRAAAQLRAAIAQRLSPEHADLLAVPEVDPTGRRIDWYAAFEGEARRLSELGESERATILRQAHRLHGDIAGLADAMEAPERSSAERNFGRLLRQALSAPGEETLHVVGGKPVVTFWGFSADAALPGVFLASPPRPPIPPRPPFVPEAVLASAPAMAAGVRSRGQWWQWLLLALLLLLLLALLAWLVRPYLPHLEPRLEAEARDAALTLSVKQPVGLQQARYETLKRDNENLRLELARLTDQLAQHGGECAAGIGIVGGVVVGSGEGKPIERGAGPGANGDLNLADKGNEKDKAGVKGDKGPDGADKASAEKGQDQAQDKSAGPKDEPKPMVVPPDAKQKQDLAFLHGTWRSRTGLATATGERDIRPNYSLDDKGKGKVSFVQKNGATCEAPAEARWDQGKLVIEEKSNPRCSDGHTYARNTVNCEIGPDGTAQCKGSQPGDQRSYNVQIGR